MTADIDLYYWPTPNGFKITIMLAELGEEYRLIPVDITRGDQFSDEFIAISPNSKIPAIVDHAPRGLDGPVFMFESGAILVYLAEKHGTLIPEDPAQRYQCLEWLFWQMGGLGPMAGQAHHFRLYAPEKIPYAIERYSKECRRLYGVLEVRLADRDYLCQSYSIADIATLPWIFRHERQGISLDDFPALHRWYRRLFEREAVATGIEVAADMRDESAFQSAEAQERLFNIDVKKEENGD